MLAYNVMFTETKGKTTAMAVQHSQGGNTKHAFNLVNK